MFQRLIRCPFCGGDTLRVHLSLALSKHNGPTILSFHCTGCSWEQSLGEVVNPVSQLQPKSKVSTVSLN